MHVSIDGLRNKKISWWCVILQWIQVLTTWDECVDPHFFFCDVYIEYGTIFHSEVVLSVLLSQFRFAVPEKQIIWEMSPISIPTVKGYPRRPQLPMIISRVWRKHKCQIGDYTYNFLCIFTTPVYPMILCLPEGWWWRLTNKQFCSPSLRTKVAMYFTSFSSYCPCYSCQISLFSLILKLWDAFGVLYRLYRLFSRNSSKLTRLYLGFPGMGTPSFGNTRHQVDMG